MIMSSGMSEKIARGISCLLHPLFLPLYMMLLFVGTDVFTVSAIPNRFRLVILSIVFLITVFFPVLLTFFLLRLKIISSFYLNKKEERIFPLLYTAILYYLTYYLFRNLQVFSLFCYFMLGATLLAIISLILSFYKKISLHMTGMGSLTGFFLGLSLNFGIHFLSFFITTVLLSGWVGFARVKLNAHHPFEIYTGFLLGTVLFTSLMLLI